MKRRDWAIFGAIIITICLPTGCASVPMASMQEDMRAKQFQVPPNKSVIYLFRDEIIGAAIRMPVSIDGRAVGHTGPKTYFMWEVEPGKHQLQSLTENVSALWIETEPGKDYYIWQEVKMGMFSARSRLQQVDRVRGREGVMECKLIRTMN